MKVGSIVECVRTPNIANVDPIFTLLNYPEKGKVYTVRSISVCPVTKNTIALLEEIIMGYNPEWVEMGCPIVFFREIEFPPSLELEINECLTRELIEK